MPRCGFCQRNFRSSQSVRAHLAHCDRYRKAKAQGKVPKGTAYIGRLRPPQAEEQPGFNPALHAREQVEAEEARLRLRQIQAAHAELDAKEAEVARQIKEQAEAGRWREREEMLARERAAAELKERKEKEQAERDRQQRRRELIQKVKDRTVRNWWRFGYTIPAELEAQALRAVEQELTALPEDLPERELIEIGEGIRDRIYRPVMETQDRERREQAERQQEELNRVIIGAIERRERQDMKQELVSHGIQFASEELDDREIRPGLPRYLILGKVTDGLDQRLTGVESKSDTEDLVEELLARELPKMQRGRR